MTKLTNALLRVFLTAAILITGLTSIIGTVYAEDGDDILVITVAPLVNCGEVQFTIQWTGETTTSYQFFMDFGEGDSTELIPTTESSITLSHKYPDQGEFEWTVQVEDTGLGGLDGTLTGMLILEGPDLTLSSSPFPPLFVLGDAGEVEFSTSVTGGSTPLTYAWDLDGDGAFESENGDTATFAYTEAGKYYPKVLVTDSCDFTASDTMPVVVADPEDACHPMAQTIADGVNTIFPDQSEDLYTCDDIYALFDNESEENNLGFGRMWKAYHLAESMEELTWEDILDWHLNESGWGSLLQLDRFADLLEDHDLPELMGLVMSEDYSLGDVRLAVRSVTRFEAEFEDVLTRIAEGANPGELGQFYKLAADLDADLEVLDGYLADGLTLSELKHTSKYSDRVEADWTDIADARSMADSWGDINQAYKLATDEVSAAEILSIGVQDYKEELRAEDKATREVDKAAGEEKQAAQTEEKNQETAKKLAEQYSAEFGDVMNLLNGECEGEWACVRSTLRDQEREIADGPSEKDEQTALQIALKYGYTKGEVLVYHKDYCGENWACTRTYFRENTLIIKETGKPDKK